MFTLIIEMYFIFASAIIKSTAHDSSVFLSTYRNTILNQSAHIFFGLFSKAVYHVLLEATECASSDTYHACFIPLKELYHLLSLFVPQEHVSAITSTHHKLALWTIKVHTFN